jgi:hypothetical protein
MFGEHPRKPAIWNCLVLTVKHGGASVVVWAAMSWYPVGPIIILHGQITAKEYVCGEAG